MRTGWTIRGGDIRQAYTQAKWPEHLRKALADLVFKECRTILKMKQETPKPGNSDNHNQQDT